MDAGRGPGGPSGVPDSAEPELSPGAAFNERRLAWPGAAPCKWPT